MRFSKHFADSRPIISLVGSFSEIPAEMDALGTAINNFPFGIQAWSFYPTSPGLRARDLLQTQYEIYASEAIASILIVGRGVPHPELFRPGDITSVEFQYMDFWHEQAIIEQRPCVVALWEGSHGAADSASGCVGSYEDFREKLRRRNWCFEFLTSDDLCRGVLEALRSILQGQRFEYDVAISFAGANRAVARSIAALLKARDIRVFFDEFEVHKLWGRDLLYYFGEIFERKARLCLIITSEHYKGSPWANQERQHAQARQLREMEEYILQLRLDDCELPGLPKTIGYLNFTNAETVAELIEKKLRNCAA